MEPFGLSRCRGRAFAGRRKPCQLCAARHLGFLRELDIYTDEELRADPLYRDIIYTRGLGNAAATIFVLPTQDRILVSLETEQARGPVEPDAVEKLDALRPQRPFGYALAA